MVNGLVVLVSIVLAVWFDIVVVVLQALAAWLLLCDRGVFRYAYCHQGSG